MHKTQKVTVILQFHNKGDREKLTEHNSAFEANTSSKAGTSSEEKNQPLAPKMECHHHHSGNRTLIFHLPLRLVSRYFLAAPRSQSVRGWPVRPAVSLSVWGTTGKFQLLPSLFPACQSADALLQQMFTPRPSSSVSSVLPSAQVVTIELLVCKLCFAIGTGGNDWIVGMAARIMTR